MVTQSMLRTYRYVYGWAAMDYWRHALVKKDIDDSRNDKTWSVENHYSGEPFFVRNPGKKNLLK